MAIDRNEVSLAQVSVDVSYGYTESAASEKIGPRFLRITDIQNGVVNWSTVPYCPITEPDHEKYRLKDGDIVVARTGNSTGENYLFKADVDAVFASYLIRFRVNQGKADPAFVWYNLRTQRWWEFINGAKTGSAQAGANAKVLGQFTFALPSIAEQKAIAKTLAAFDDKIELNRRMNETLEAMARAIFKSWFVDFDPVRAKSEGREPSGMDEATAALFPNNFLASPLGPLPRGWEVWPFDKAADFLNGLAMQKFPAREGEPSLPVIKISQLRSGDTSDADRASFDVPAEYIVEDGDVLFSWSGSLEVVAWAGGKGGLNQHLFKVTSKDFPKWFCYHWLLHHLPEFRNIAADKATTMGHIQRKHLTAALVVVPPQSILQKAEALIAPLFELALANALESRTLAATRDTLLPRLLSGEVTV